MSNRFLKPIFPLILAASAAVSLSAFAQTDKFETKPDAKADAKPADKSDALPPLPADAHVDQTIQLAGKPLKYTATVGTLPVRDSEGKLSGQVVFISSRFLKPSVSIAFSIVFRVL